MVRRGKIDYTKFYDKIPPNKAICKLCPNPQPKDYSNINRHIFGHLKSGQYDILDNKLLNYCKKLKEQIKELQQQIDRQQNIVQQNIQPHQKEVNTGSDLDMEVFNSQQDSQDQSRLSEQPNDLYVIGNIQQLRSLNIQNDIDSDKDSIASQGTIPSSSNSQDCYNLNDTEFDFQGIDPNLQDGQSPLWISPWQKCVMSTNQICYNLFQFQQQEQVSGKGLQVLLSLISIILPQPNNLPITLYRIEKLLEKQKPEDFLQHVCLCGRFDYLPKNLWMDNKDEVCEGCQEPRFEFRRGKLQPKRYMYDLGLEDTIKNFYSNKEFSTAIHKQFDNEDQNLKIEENIVNSVYSTQIFKNFLTRTNQSLANASNMLNLELAIDDITVTQRQDQERRSSITVVGARALNLPQMLRYKQRFCQTFILIPKKKSKTNDSHLDGYLANTINFLQINQHQGVNVQPVYCKAKNIYELEYSKKTYLGPNMKVQVFLNSIYADMVMRCTLHNFCGQTAKDACPYCWQRGQWSEQQHCQLWFGYSEQLKLDTRRLIQNENGDIGLIKDTFQGFAWDAGKEIDNTTRICLGDIVQYCGNKANEYLQFEEKRKFSAKGQLTLYKELPYMDYREQTKLSYAHSWLEGILNRVLLAIFNKDGPAHLVLSTSQKDEAKARADKITLTSDYNRDYTCVVTSHSSYIMEQMLTFVESIQQFIFYQNAPEIVLTLMKHIKRITSYLFRGEENGVSLNNVFESLKQFAIMAEQHYPQVCTINLHYMVCRFFSSEALGGPWTNSKEVWVERNCQHVKKFIPKQGGSKDPCHLIVKGILIERALDKLKLKCGLLDINQITSELKYQDFDVKNQDNFDSKYGSFFNGAGVQVNRTEITKQKFKRLYQCNQDNFEFDINVERIWDQIYFVKYQIVIVNSQKINVKSLNRIRQDCWVIIKYEIGQREYFEIAQVKVMFNAIWQENTNAMLLVRFIQCNTFETQDLGDGLYRVANISKIKQENYYAPLEAINHKMIKFEKEKGTETLFYKAKAMHDEM